MGTEQIVERILSDARQNAQTSVNEAEAKASELLAAAEARIEKLENDVKAEVEEKRTAILEKRAAAARLDSAKLLLAEKRKVIDAIYDEALSRLLELGKEDCILLITKLLEAYAEEGDEILFAENFRYADEVKLLPVINGKALKISEERLPLDGGLRLRGERSDKDLSFGALLSADREENQAELARQLFR